ncbi:MAG: DUF935 family protein [Bacteroidales bacterium]|nr:DUF935 family protein [Bacteroidales bacterium]
MATKAPEIILKKSGYDRTAKDISKWKTALKSAEDPDYPDRSKLMDLYHDLMLDGHLTAITEKRILNITNLPIAWQTGTGKQNVQITDLIESEAFENLLRSIIESRFFGYSLNWVDITQPGVQKPKVKVIDRRHVEPSRNKYKTKIGDTLNAGIDYTVPPLSNYILTAGRDDDLGLLLKCAPYVLWKRGDIGDWATFAEIFGSPLRKGKFPLGDDQSKRELEEAMNEAGNANSVIMPDSCDIEFVQNSTTTSGKGVHETFADFLNNEMSKIILGNTMTTDAQGGNYKGEVHQDSEEGIFEGDKKFSLRILNSTFWYLLEMHGYNPTGGKFVVPDTDDIDLKDRIDIDEKLNGMIDIDPAYFYEKYGVPVPKGGAKLKSVETQGVASPKSAKLSDPEARPIRRGLFNFFD